MPQGFQVPQAYDPVTGKLLTPEEQARLGFRPQFEFDDPTALGEGQGFAIERPSTGNPALDEQLGGYAAQFPQNTPAPDRVTPLVSGALNELTRPRRPGETGYIDPQTGRIAIPTYREDLQDAALGALGFENMGVQAVGPVLRSLAGGIGLPYAADKVLPEDTPYRPQIIAGLGLAGFAAEPIARGSVRGAKAINAATDSAALRAAEGPAIRSGYQNLGTAIPGEALGQKGTRFQRRVAGGAEFTEEELFAQQAHIEREIGANPNLTSAIGKIQDNIAAEEALRTRGGVVEGELKAGRKRQATGALDARTWAVENRATLREAAQVAAEETKTGGNRQTFAPGANLTDDESRAIARLLATSPALEGKVLTYRNYAQALQKFLDGGTIHPEQRKRLSDLLGVSLERKPRKAEGARPPGTPAQYPARITGTQDAPVVQTFKNEPQQEIAGLARVLGSDGQMKEGVIQPSLFEPDTYMVVDPKTGNAIPDFRADGTVIPGSELRKTVTSNRSPNGPQQFPGTVGMENAPVQPGIGLDTPPLEGFPGAPENILTSEQQGLAATARRAREAEAAMARLPGETDEQFMLRQSTIAQRSHANLNPATGRPAGMDDIRQPQNLIEPSALEAPTVPTKLEDASIDMAQVLARDAEAKARRVPRPAPEGRPTWPGSVGNFPSAPGAVNMRAPESLIPTTAEAGANRGRQIAMPGVSRVDQKRGSVWQNVKDGISGVRAVLSSDVMSLAFRQGRKTIVPHNRAWRRAVSANIKSFMSEDRAWKASDAVDASPNRARYDEMGIDLPDPNNYDMAVQEEAFLHGSSMTARAVQRIPLVKRAERASATFMKVLRAGMADDIIGIIPDEQWRLMDTRDKRALGDIINAGTGRGKIPEIAKGSVQGLNTVFYSTRNQIANVQVPATMFFGRNSAVRKEAAKLYVSDMLVKWSIRGLWAAAGGKVGLDVLSPDWSKLITPDGQRIDMDGGDAQLARLVANFYAGGSVGRDTGAFTRKDRREIVANYLANKFAPVPSTLNTLTDKFPNEGVGEEAFKAGAYMWLQDLVEAARAAREQGHPDISTARASLVSLLGSQVGIGVDSPRTPQLAAKAGRYVTMPPEEQVKAFGAQTWTVAGQANNVPQPLRQEIGKYQSYSAWRVQALEKYEKRYTAAYKERGQKLEPGMAQELAKRALAQNPIQQVYSQGRNAYEQQWVVANPQLALKVMNEDAKYGETDPRRRLSLSLPEIAFLIRESQKR